MSAGWSLPAPALELARELRAGGASWRAGLERLLAELDPQLVERCRLELKEGRGAWTLGLEARGGRALFLGHPLSGTLTALARHGLDVTLAAAPGELRELARWRAAERTARALELVDWRPGTDLDVAQRSFDLVVLESGLGAGRAADQRLVAQAAGAARRQFALLADNRFGYKRSAGGRGVFRLPTPFEYLRDALAPREGQGTLAGFRGELGRAGFQHVRAAAPYPHRLDHAQLAALDAPAPRLVLGPHERRNKLKLAGRALGLFPHLTPSFLLIGSRAAPEPSHVERLLDALAERSGEPRGELEHLIATGGGAALLMTRGDAQGRGAWVVHVPLSPRKAELLRRHAQHARGVRQRFPQLPVPEILFDGTLAGLDVLCERRVPGWSAAQRRDDPALLARAFTHAARIFSELLVAAPRPFTSEDFERELAPRLASVRAKAGVPGTLAWLDHIEIELRRRLIGRAVARVQAHSDLRAKHLQIDEHGAVTGVLDWSTADAAGLPYLDLVHLVIHEHKDARGGTSGAAWRTLLARRDLAPWAAAELERGRQAVGLDTEAARVLEEAYPMFVAAVGERSWDFTPPRWLHRSFGL